MLIAHAPTGYIVSKTMTPKKETSYVVCSLIFALWPDLDLLYYYLFKEAGAFHHTYFPHLPVVMLIFLFATLPLIYIKRLKRFKVHYYLFFINWALHLLLDTFTGGIMWLYPLNSKLFTIIKIPPISQNWIVSFVLHWSFIIEMAIVAWAVALLFRARRM